MPTAATPTPAPMGVKTFVAEEKILGDLSLDSSNSTTLRAEHARQAGLVYFYSYNAAKAERQSSFLKLHLETVEASVATTVRSDAQAAGEKLTADMVKERVRLHPRTLAIEKLIIEAREIESVLKGVMQALRDKSSSLTSLTNMERDELRALMNVEQEAHDRTSGKQKGHMGALRNAG